MTAETQDLESVEQRLRQHDAKDLLRFITCGSVDDGKSTLIGRMLLEVGAVYDDQIESLACESERHGNVGDGIDPALLLDGLEDERQQGITIDVAYRYFTTNRRKFIIADTPGHEQFTRNMVTGASTADLAVLLVDATKGISTQTRRHAHIVSLLGIRNVVLAVNKMDLIDYDQASFASIRDSFGELASDLCIDHCVAVPISALHGDNLCRRGDRMSWYEGPTLLDHLDGVRVDQDREEPPMRFPVQWVNRPDARFRGYSGTIASGMITVGDEVTVVPSGKTSRVASLVTMDGSLESAGSGDSITVTLEDEIDITRGDMLVHTGREPNLKRQGEANLVWMSSEPLVPGKAYWLKHATQRTSCEVESIRYQVDVNTLRRRTASSLALNQIGRCKIRFHDSLAFDAYSENRATGSFIVVDRLTHETVAAGMFTSESGDLAAMPYWDQGYWEQDSVLKAPQPARSHLREDDRRRRFGHRPLTFMITGLSGSGKTSVAMALEKRLFDAGHTSVVLDGQSLRLGLNRDLGFSSEERSENLRRAAEIAKIVNDTGLICIAAFVAPNQWVRTKVRELIGVDRIVHIHLTTPIEVCRQRDLTGQYVAADRGEITSFPGVSSEYEIPADADLAFDAGEMTAEEIAGTIIAQVKP